jgi:hypothetical protein
LFSLYKHEFEREYAFYSFNLERYEERAKRIRDGLDAFGEGISEEFKKDPKPKFYKASIKADYLPIDNVSLKANLVDSVSFYILQLRNYYYKRIEVKALLRNTDTVWMESPISILPYLIEKAPDIINVQLSIYPDKVLYRIAGNESDYIQKVTKYRAPLK